MVNGKLKDRGYRITAGRKAILDVLMNTEGHLSAEDIYLKVHSTYPSIGLASVYRTLDILVNVGIVYKLDFNDRKARYELAEGPGGKRHHHHLICSVCNQVIDYKDFSPEELELLKRVEDGLYKRYDFKITNHVIQFYGTCDACRNREKDVVQHYELCEKCIKMEN